MRINNNLSDFTKNSDKSIANTVPVFLKQKGKIGCLADNKVDYVSTYHLNNKIFCSADIQSRISEAANELEASSLSVSKTEELLRELISEDTEKRYCFVHNDINCRSNNIISYKRNAVYYLQIAIYSLTATYVFSLILQLLYFKALIYVIYGKKK